MSHSSGELVQTHFVPLFGLVYNVDLFGFKIVIGNDNAFLIEGRFDTAFAHAAQPGYTKCQFGLLCLRRHRGHCDS
ncbi:MAG TPA: hypothetical protein DCS71_03315 [Flavobacteriales bacterium]|nr:hypothetical protein [Flavobacteriales bacterium]